MTQASTAPSTISSTVSRLKVSTWTKRVSGRPGNIGMRITRISKHHYELDQEVYLEVLERSHSRTYSWRAKQGVRNPLGPTLGKGLTSFVDVDGLASADPSTLTKEEKSDLELHRDLAKRKTFNSKLPLSAWQPDVTCTHHATRHCFRRRRRALEGAWTRR